MGYDPDRLLALGLTPDTVLPPYVLDEDLCLTANAANVQAAGQDPEIPLPETDRAQMYETGSALVFTNFMSASMAMEIFVRNLFQSELDSGEFRFVLSDTLSRAGASVDAGAVDGKNAWFLSWVVGSVARIQDMQVLHLINQIRADTSLINAYISPDELSLFQRTWQLKLLMRMQYQPLFSDETLHGYAAWDVHGRSRTDELNPEVVFNPGPEYSREYFQFTPVIAYQKDLSIVDPVTFQFVVLLMDEVYYWPFYTTVFSNRYSLGGVSVLPASFETGNIGRLSLFSAAPAEPRPEPPALTRVYGLVYQDLNRDGFYSVGTEMPGKTVTVYDDTYTPVAVRVTDNAGYFELALEPGRQWTFEVESEGQIVQASYLIEKDRFVKLGFEPYLP